MHTNPLLPPATTAYPSLLSALTHKHQPIKSTVRSAGRPTDRGSSLSVPLALSERSKVNNFPWRLGYFSVKMGVRMVTTDIPGIESNKDAAVWPGGTWRHPHPPHCPPSPLPGPNDPAGGSVHRQRTDSTGRTHGGMNEPLLWTHTQTHPHRHTPTGGPLEGRQRATGGRASGRSQEEEEEEEEK